MPCQDFRSNKLNHESAWILKIHIICLFRWKKNIGTQLGRKKGKKKLGKLSDNISQKKKSQKTDIHRRPCISTMTYTHFHPTKLNLL